MTCPSCGSGETIKNGGGKAMCKACGRQWLITKRKREGNGISATCRKCGASGEIFHRKGAKKGHEQIVCRECNHEQPRPKQQAQAQGTIYVVTSAQNATKPHKGFMAALQQYCLSRNASLLIVPIRYKNPSRKGEAEEDDWWHESLAPFLVDRRTKLAPGLQLLADIKIQPTAVAPLSGLDTITGTDCGIFGHPKVAMDSIPTRGHELPKLLWTTGSITVPNYSESKAGAKGHFHHVMGALVVERDGDLFHVRNIGAEASGAFIDLDKRYTPDGVEPAKPALAIALGDDHAEKNDRNVFHATFGSGGIVDTLQPRHIVHHDVLNFGSAGHHNTFFERVLRRMTGQDDVSAELALTCAFLDECYRPWAETVVVSSNHHSHLTKWLEKSDYRMDTQNALVYAEVLAEMLGVIKREKRIPDPFALVAKRMCERPARFLGPNESLLIKGVEYGYHGDIGPNGSRGSAKAMDKIGAKTTIGHSHTPRIVGGCYQTGTSSVLDMGYNVGPSSWLQSHVVQYANGKRTHIHIIDGRWRA